MAPPIQYPLINGHRYSFASIEARFNGIPIIGFKSLNYSDELAPGEVYGSRPQLLGATRGKQKASADFEMYRLEFEALKATLGIGGVGFGEQKFDIVAQYAELGQPVITDTVVGFRIQKVEFSNADGTDAIVAKVTGFPLRVLFNGVPIATPALPLGI
jgi:hypothetical protein